VSSRVTGAILSIMAIIGLILAFICLLTLIKAAIYFMAKCCGKSKIIYLFTYDYTQCLKCGWTVSVQALISTMDAVQPLLGPIIRQCIHSGQLIFRKTSKIGATGCQDFKAKMHQIRFPLGLVPDPAPLGELRAYNAPPDSLAVFKGLLLRVGRGKGR